MPESFITAVVPSHLSVDFGRGEEDLCGCLGYATPFGRSIRILDPTCDGEWVVLPGDDLCVPWDCDSSPS